MKGGPRPGAGRPCKPLPATAEEGAAELRRYAPDVEVVDGRVVLAVADVVALVVKLRRRKAPRVAP